MAFLMNFPLLKQSHASLSLNLYLTQLPKLTLISSRCFSVQFPMNEIERFEKKKKPGFEGMLPSYIHGKLPKLGISKPSLIQKTVMNPIIRGVDTVICSKTGTGKTLSYLLPLFTRIDNYQKTTQVLIVVPTRELAIQIESVMRLLAKGGKKKRADNPITIERLSGWVTPRFKYFNQKSPHILIGTPHSIHRVIQMGLPLNNIFSVVFEEIDHLLLHFTRSYVIDILGKSKNRGMKESKKNVKNQEKENEKEKEKEKENEKEMKTQTTQDQSILEESEKIEKTKEIESIPKAPLIPWQILFVGALVNQNVLETSQKYMQPPIFYTYQGKEITFDELQKHVLEAPQQQDLEIEEGKEKKNQKEKNQNHESKPEGFEELDDDDESIQVNKEDYNNFNEKREEELVFEPQPAQHQYILNDNPSDSQFKIFAQWFKKTNPRQVLVFVNNQKTIEDLHLFLTNMGIRSRKLSNSTTSQQRRLAVRRLNNGKLKILLTTDMASRGLNFPHLSHVFNFDLPTSPATYLHRSGRVSRLQGLKNVFSVSLCPNTQLEVLDTFSKSLDIQFSQINL